MPSSHTFCIFSILLQQPSNNLIFLFCQQQGDGNAVPSGMQLFSAYKQGLVDPNALSTQQLSTTGSSNKPQQPAPPSKTASEPRIPASWLNTGRGLGKLTGAVAGVSKSASSSALTSGAYRVVYEPKSVDSG